MLTDLALHIEAIVFSAEHPVPVSELKQCLEEAGAQVLIEETEIIQAITNLQEQYNKGKFSFTLEKVAEGYQFLTKPEFHGTLAIWLNQKNTRKLSTAALETLSIIAYKQPVTKAEIEHIRGVSCDHTINRLLEKELIEISGRENGPGNPLLYSTSSIFMEHFGLRSSKDLPRLKDIETDTDNEFGQTQAIEVQEDI